MDGEEMDVCVACGTERSVEDGEMVVTDRTYVDHMMVSEDREFVCNDCISAAEEAQIERGLSRRYP